jgi:hypothetical protein
MITPNGGVFGRNPKFNNVTVDGNLTVNGDLALGDDITVNDTLTVNGLADFNGGLKVTPNAVAPESNVTIGPSAGANLVADSVDNILLGSGAGDVLGASGRNVAIGTDALGAFSAGAASITNTTPGTGGTPGTYNNVVLEKDSGTGDFTVYPTVTIVVGAGGTVTSVSITSPGTGATAASGIVFKSSTAGVPTDWRGTLASVTGGNIAIGHNAGLLQTTASANTIVGSLAGDAITTGASITLLGQNAGGAITTASSITALGFNALAASTVSASNTVAIGSFAAQSLTAGLAHVIIGHQAGASLTSSEGLNVIIGQSACNGGGRTSIGNSVVIGRNAQPSGSGQTNVIVLGAEATGDGSNTTVIGVASTTQARVFGGTFLSTGANGQSTQLGQSTTLLSTTSGATVTATNLIPANCILLGVTARVTTAITGATTFDIGDGSTADRFGDDIAIALNTTANNCIAPALITAATNVVLTANGSDFTAGAVRLTAHYMTLVAPTS